MKPSSVLKTDLTTWGRLRISAQGLQPSCSKTNDVLLTEWKLLGVAGGLLRLFETFEPTCQWCPAWCHYLSNAFCSQHPSPLVPLSLTTTLPFHRTGSLKTPTLAAVCLFGMGVRISGCKAASPFSPSLGVALEIPSLPAKPVNGSP